MANALTTQVIIDGPRNTVVKVTGILDTSDLANTVIADPSTLAGIDNTGTLKAAGFRLVGMNYSIQDTLSVTLSWDATTPVVIETLTGRGATPPSVQRYGGLTNNAGAGKTGKILLSTQGWAAAAVLHFTLLIELVKVQSGVVAVVPGTAANQQYVDNAGTIPQNV